ncbi:MAG: class I SAM-dependent methyltransferase [Acidiferrobacterales bacterium]
MSAKENQPDWDKIGEKFDMWLPQLQAAGNALIERLGARTGNRVIDIASGTGEPGLSLARNTGGDIEIVGVDAAEGMVIIANRKVAEEGLKGVSFSVMPAESLQFDNESFDRALCRFGIMLYEDPLAGTREMYRVLKPGGRFAVAVWSAPETMLTLHWTYQVMAPRLPEEVHPPLAKVTSLGGPGVLEDLFFKAGFSDFVVEAQVLNYQFESFDEYWDLVVASDILKMQFDALPDNEHDIVRNEVGQLARDFIVDGKFVAPHEYLIAYGTR